MKRTQVLKFTSIALLVGAIVGCSEATNQNVAEDVTEDAKAEYKAMIAAEEAKMAGDPPDTEPTGQ